MVFYIARCIWREDGTHGELAPLPDAWSLLDEEFYSQEEADLAAREDRVQQVQQRGSWMGVHRIGLRHLDHRIIEAEDFDAALIAARELLSVDGAAQL